MMDLKVKGYILGAIAAISYGMNPLFALPLYESGMSTNSVLFFRYLFAIPIVGAMLYVGGQGFRVERRSILTLMIMGVLFAISSMMLFESYNHMDAGIASTLLFVYPIMVAVIMTSIFKERITLQTMLCIVMATVGIGLLYKGEDGTTLSLIGTLLVIGSALAYAIYIVGANRTILKDMDNIQVTFYILLFGWSVFVVRVFTDGGLQTPNEWYLWGSCFMLGLIPTAISLYCITMAIAYIGSTPTAILGALEPATAIFFGITVFGETLTFRECIGLILIVSSVSLVVAGGAVPSFLERCRRFFPKLNSRH